MTTIGSWRGTSSLQNNEEHRTLSITSVAAQPLDCERALITQAKSHWEFYFSVKLEEQAAKHKLRVKLRFAVVCVKFYFNTNPVSKKIGTTRHMYATDLPVKKNIQKKTKNRAVGSVAGSGGEEERRGGVLTSLKS